MKRRVDQLLAGFADGDAISQEALAIRDLLRDAGMESDIYADSAFTSPSMLAQCRDARSYVPGDAVLHHYSIGSPVLDQFAQTRAVKVLIYHNITPASYFAPYDMRVMNQLIEARRLLPEVAGNVNAVWADSEFNAGELRDLGISTVQVFPLIFDRRAMMCADVPPIAARLSPVLTTLLSVGRIAPNKRIEVLIKAFHYYVRRLNPFSRLVIVGSRSSCPRYFDLLQMMVSDLDIPNVCFEGFAAPESLATYYRNADLYVSTSDHEGYCLPLLEAMYHKALVLAHHVGGMPEAMGKGGVRYANLDPVELATLFDAVLEPGVRRDAIVAAQDRRIQEVVARPVQQELMMLMNAVFT